MTKYELRDAASDLIFSYYKEAKNRPESIEIEFAPDDGSGNSLGHILFRGKGRQKDIVLNLKLDRKDYEEVEKAPNKYRKKLRYLKFS